MVLQIPNYVGENLARDQGFRNQMELASQLKSQKLVQERAGMENQEMARQTANRNELEMLLMHTPEEERERAAFEWSRVKDPDFHNKLGAQYVARFAQTARLDPKGAAAALERATGEKIELGNRFSKLPTEGSEVWVDNFSGHVFEPKNVQEAAQLRADLATQLQEMKGELATTVQGMKTEGEATKQAEQNKFTAEQNRLNRESRERVANTRAAGSGRSTASEELQKKRTRQAAKNKKDKALNALENQLKLAEVGKAAPLSPEELRNRKQMIQDQFENDLIIGGFEVEPFEYPEAQAATAPPAATTEPTATAKEITATGPNGEKIVVRNGKWVPK